MDDALRNRILSPPRTQKHKNYRHLQTDCRSVDMHPVSNGTVSQNSLKTQMLGGQAKTIWRLGGSN